MTTVDCAGEVILHASGVCQRVRRLRGSSPPPSGDFDLRAFVRRNLSRATDDLYAKIHGEVDRIVFTMALDHTRGNHSNAARLLGISRQTMRMKLRALGIYVGHAVRSEDGTDEAIEG